ARRLAEIPGVTAVDTRVMTIGRGELPGFDEPIQVQAVSIPEFGRPRLNRLHVVRGRLPEGTERDAMAVSDAFAEAHDIRAGDRMTIILHGRRQSFRIVGVAGSPEFIAQLSPQAVFPDPRRHAIVWLPRPVIAAATDLDGAFNSIALRLQPGARAEPVLAEMDRQLARFGGIGAITREHQQSHRYLSEEFRQLRTMARLFPAVFLSVSAFVLYVVLSRLIAGQREQIGTLKAFGYSRGEIWRHYAGFALVAGGAGAILGLALGGWLGTQLASIYRDFYRLPYLDFSIPGPVVWLAFVVSIGSALAGAALPVAQASRLMPAEAMRAEVPYRRPLRWLDRTAALRRMDTSHRLILRNLLQRPMRTLLTWLGLALGTAIMMMGRFQNDAVGLMVDQQFRQAAREDIDVAFVEPVAPRAAHELLSLPGVLGVEPERAVAVEVRFRAASHRTALVGLPPAARLRRNLDHQGRQIMPSAAGVLMTDQLATMIGARAGDRITFETLEGRRRVLELPLAGLVSEPFGVKAYLPLATLNRLMGEGERISGAALSVDGASLPDVIRHLHRRPLVSSVEQRLVGIRNFHDSMARTILTFTLIATGFGAVITAGVVYSSARVTLSERSRDLASLRVLGFDRYEVGYLLLGELALLTVLALPLGYLLGNGLIALLVMGFDSDLMRIPHHVSPATYAITGLGSLIAATGSGWLVRRMVHRLDLIAVLKA
ncbi:MAG TPA: ABC transporter permease, partial [Lysobacter sp.]